MNFSNFAHSLAVCGCLIISTVQGKASFTIIGYEPTPVSGQYDIIGTGY
jgi:hypothetical protein